MTCICVLTLYLHFLIYLQNACNWRGESGGGGADEGGRIVSPHYFGRRGT